ncbi:MAG: hypothetical protein HN509_07945 [Halobacteriovoraceae bacterium]|jgi:hypothetical protein|nr:hypothetical protein [Halobacteriovoraceae bacterium]MBT5095317.1 hypothetical protein [Halobacteriovoraceae bacterium]
MYRLFYIAFILLLVTKVATAESEFSGEVSLENRYFVNKDPLSSRDQSETSLVLKPEYSRSWDQDRKVVTVIPYVRLNSPDNRKTSFDLREASIVSAWEKWELRAGISKVYWGVTESQHLVDVINQTDSVSNIDGEEKLGQPMINTTYLSQHGNIDLFLLPYFRERTFAGKNGRLRGPLLVDTDNPLYEHEDEERHIDYAARYSHTLFDIDLGFSYFRGTDRDPLFTTSKLSNVGGELRPFYVQTEQAALDLQYIYKDWLFKFEGIRKDSHFQNSYIASTAGFEYSFSNIFGGLDLGVIAEHLYDERGVGSLAAFNNHTFVGSRLALNDELSTELLVGAIFNNEEGDLNSLRVEGSRRINENWKWELEGNAFLNSKPDQLLHSFRDDDYLQFSINYYF